MRPFGSGQSSSSGGGGCGGSSNGDAVPSSTGDRMGGGRALGTMADQEGHIGAGRGGIRERIRYRNDAGANATVGGWDAGSAAVPTAASSWPPPCRLLVSLEDEDDDVDTARWLHHNAVQCQRVGFYVRIRLRSLIVLNLLVSVSSGTCSRCVFRGCSFSRGTVLAAASAFCALAQ